MSKLILVNGLPGSGKSTTAQWLELQLRRNGFAAHWIHEANVPHPLWLGGNDGSRFTLPDFEQITPEVLIQSNLDKWRRFTDTVHASDAIYVVESYPFLNAMGVLLWGDIERGLIVEYGCAVQEIIQALDPVLIYLYHTDVAASWRRICGIRGSEFEQLFIANMVRQPYCKHRKLHSTDCVIALWTAIHALAQQCFAEYTICKLMIDISADAWAQYRQRICDFLALSLVQDKEIISEQQLYKFAGCYCLCDSESETRRSVEVTSEGLVMHYSHSYSVRLVPIDAYTFYEEGGSAGLVTFGAGASGVVREMCIDRTRMQSGISRWQRES